MNTEIIKAVESDRAQKTFYPTPEPLAEKLREDPGIAQKLYELEHYFTFC